MQAPLTHARRAEWERIKAKAVPQELANANKDIIPNVYTREVLKDTAAPERKVCGGRKQGRTIQ